MNMKKILSTTILCLITILALTFAACQDDKNGTYYPSTEEIKINLESNDYVVTLYQDLSDSNGNTHKGTFLFASKDRENKQEEYIYFYRFDNASSCQYYYELLEKNCKNYNSLVKLENDEKFGNIVYCATENAVNDAGIKVIKVDVDVKI